MHNILLNYDKKKLMKTNEDKEDKDKDKLSLNNNNNKQCSKDNEFIFKTFQLEKCKILIMIRNNNIFVSTYPTRSSSQFQRLLLIHIFIALINFKGDSIKVIGQLNKYEKYNQNDYINLKSFYNKYIKQNIKEINSVLELLIFENYFLKIIILHFSKVFNELFKKEYLNLNQTRFKNLYIIDLHTSSIILDMRKIQGSQEIIHYKKYINNNALFNVLLQHAENMYSSYIKENNMVFTSIDSIYRFVKFECTSTYPRLLFIVKFIPVLKGIAVIHIYYQKKLSRNLENPLEQEVKYKEIDLLCGSSIRNNQNLEFKYGAPKKLQHIEKFFEEFYITNRNEFDIFKIINNSKKYKYVNYSIINVINHVPVSLEIEQFLLDINKKLNEEYNKEINTKKEKEKIKEKKKNEENENNENNESNNEKENENDDENSYDNIFTLNKEIFYSEILNIKNKEIKDNIKPVKKMKKKQISSIFADSIGKSLISDEDKKENDINVDSNKTFKNTNKQNYNINIDNMIYTEENTERKNLIKKNNEIFSNNRGGSQISSFSMISEVKTKEKFKIKVFDLKGSSIKDKMQNIYNNSKEKDYKLSELLDITYYNNKSNNDTKKNKKNNCNEIGVKNTEAKNIILSSINDM